MEFYSFCFQGPFKIVSVKTVPPEEENTETECGICKKVFSNRIQLKNHVKITHDPNNKKACHNCKECPEVFFLNNQVPLFFRPPIVGSHLSDHHL